MIYTPFYMKITQEGITSKGVNVTLGKEYLVVGVLGIDEGRFEFIDDNNNFNAIGKHFCTFSRLADIHSLLPIDDTVTSPSYEMSNEDIDKLIEKVMQKNQERLDFEAVTRPMQYGIPGEEIDPGQLTYLPREKKELDKLISIEDPPRPGQKEFPQKGIKPIKKVR